MLTSQKQLKLRERLLRERDRILESRAELEDYRRDLLEREIELEESAQKADISEPLASINDRGEDRLEAVDRALDKMATGRYGICEHCGKRIEEERLEAIPWATLCRRCKEESEKETMPRARPERQPASGLPPDLQGLPDEDIVRYIYEELEQDGRIELGELTVNVENKTVHLGGFLPGDAQKQALMSILIDTLGLVDLVDEISIDPLLRETAQGEPGERERIGEAQEESSIETETEDAYTSRTTGATLSPPDQLIPEEKKTRE